MSRRRRGGGDALTIIYWRDIPAQVTATQAGESAKVLLEPRFQHAIDRAATVADLTETEAYVAQWRRDPRPLAGDPAPGSLTRDDLQERATQAADELSERYPRERLEALVAQGGAESDQPGEPPAPSPLRGEQP